MRDKIDFDTNYGTKESVAIIKVIGVGGGGGNAVEHMYSDGIVGVDFVVCNTDRQALENNRVPNKLVLGEDGLGAGNNPAVARQLAEESREKIKELFNEKTRMVFITAGMGKGTGTGAGPVVASVAKEMGILTVGVVTYPFDFQGIEAIRQADEGIAEMRKNVDSLIIIKNENLLKYYEDLDVETAYAVADDVLKNAVKSIAELITVKATQNVDFNDVKTILQDSGDVVLGLATAEGENRVDLVVKEAISCPLINEELITDAKRFLFFVTYGTQTLKMAELNELTKKLEEVKCDDTKLIFGMAKDESLGNSIKLAVIIANYQTEEQKQKRTATNVTITEPMNTDDEVVVTQTPVAEQQEHRTTPTAPVNTETNNGPSWWSAQPVQQTETPRSVQQTMPQQPQDSFIQAPELPFNQPSANFGNFPSNAASSQQSSQFGPQRVGTLHTYDTFDRDIETPAIYSKQQTQMQRETFTMTQNRTSFIDDDSHDLIFKGLPD